MVKFQLLSFQSLIKAFFQQLCIDKLDWDEELQGEYRKTYDKLLSELRNFDNVNISRCFFQQGKNVEHVEIHDFSDASERAYALVV